MKIEDFIIEAMAQISRACADVRVDLPYRIELLIQINAEGKVCAQGDVAIGTVKVEL